MLESLYFNFDGISSIDMGVCIISNGSLFEESLFPSRTIVETSVPKNYKPYFQRVDYEPLSFSLTFFIKDWKERNNVREIAEWLFKDYYKPLSFESNPERYFYVIFNGDSTLIHNGCKEGYIELSVRCDSPFSYSLPVVYDNLSSNKTTATKHSVLNEGSLSIKPKIWIKKTVSNGSASITNTTNGQVTTINNLQLNEEVFVDFEHETIVSSLESLAVYRYKDHNDVWLELNVGENDLNLLGDFTLRIEYEQKYITTYE